MGVRDSLASKDVSVKVIQTGFVNVQNYKQITVDTGFFLPNAEAFAPYVDVKKGDTNVNVEQTGFVNIQLNDVINVRVNVAFQRTAQAAAFDRAQAGR